MGKIIGGTVAALILGLGPVAAQGVPAVGAPTLAEAMKTLPDHTRYRVEMATTDLSPQQLEQLAQMVGDAARGQHFYGAVYSYRPVDDDRTEYKMRSGLHSREAARQAAQSDCELARAAGDGACLLVGEVVPEGWSVAMPELSHVAVEALQQTAGALPGNVVVARSGQGDGFEIRSGADVRDETLEACNAANATAGLDEDCAIVIDDLTGAP